MTPMTQDAVLQQIQKMQEDPAQIRMCVREAMAWTAQNHCEDVLYLLYEAQQTGLLQALKTRAVLTPDQEALLARLDRATHKFREDLDREIELWACARLP